MCMNAHRDVMSNLTYQPPACPMLDCIKGLNAASWSLKACKAQNAAPLRTGRYVHGLCQDRGLK